MIWNLAIRRPVLTTVAFLIIAIFGVWSYGQMPVREDPDVEFPIVSVSVVLPGAEPEVIETEIVDPLESQINTIEGLKELTSTARPQVATLTAEFELDRDIDVAVQDVRDRIERARGELPDGIEPPLVEKIDPDAFAIMWLTLTGDDRWDAVRLTDFAQNVLKEQLENIRGVGQIRVGGSRAFAVRIRLDPERMAAFGVTAQDVVGAIRTGNVDIPSGRVESETREFRVKTQGQFAGPEPFNDLVVAARDGAVVRLSDVGEAVAGIENDRQVARFAGELTVGLGVVKQSDANAVAVAEAVLARMERLEAGFPAGLTWRLATDDTEYIEDTIADLVTTIGLAAALVVLVVLAFLRSPRGTLITSLAIPTSLLAGLAVINLLGFSLNTLTMMGFILVIGIVVDDAIVILENTYRHQEEGAEPTPAARTGTTEVAFAAIANSLSLAAVFIPVAFTAGIIGRFLYEFGLTVAITVFASTFTALTLTPMLSSRFLKVPTRHGPLFRWSERMFSRFEGVYGRSLDLALRHRWLTLLAAVLAGVLGFLFFRGLSSEFVPDVDREGFMVSFQTPEGSTLGETDRFARAIEEVLADTPEVTHQFLAIGLSQAGPGQVNEGVAFVHMTPREERARHQSEVMQALRERLARLPGGRAFVTSGGGGGGAPLQVVLQSPDLDRLVAMQEEVMAWMRGRPEFVGVDTNLRMNSPEVRVRVDRDEASTLGVSVADVSETLRLLLGEPAISEIERESERYEVLTEITTKGAMVPSDLGDIWVRGRDGTLVSIGNLVELEEGVGPAEIHHFNRIRSATLSASTPPGVALGDALETLEARLGEVLPAGFEYDLTGQAQSFQESFRYLAIAIAFSVVFIFLILAAQFESFVHPFTILLSLPLATVGAFGALFVAGMTFSIYSFIGLIMLMGMATKNAILLVDYANILRLRGRPLVQAAAEAGRVRFRPVLMTTVSTVLGMLPIALGFGAGGEARMPLGIAVAAGLITTTFLTLVVIPVFYTVIDQARAAILGRLRRAT